MANWAYTSYAIEGPKETLKIIKEAIKKHPVEEGSSENWEGNVLKALNIEWKPYKAGEGGYYMRGFIDDGPWWDRRALRFTAEEAWEITDFYKVLEDNFPTIKVYWSVEEPDSEIYATNDIRGVYFPDRFFVDTCIKGNYQSDYFITKEDVYTWLAKITEGEVTDEKEMEAFNEKHEELKTDEDNFINIHKYTVVKN